MVDHLETWRRIHEDALKLRGFDQERYLEQAVPEALRAAADGARREAVPDAPWPGKGPDFNRWNTHLRAFIDVLGKFDWTREWRFKYVNLWIDTRDGAFIFSDRDMNKASPDDLARHVRALLPTPPQPDSVAAAREVNDIPIGLLLRTLAHFGDREDPLVHDIRAFLEMSGIPIRKDKIN